MVTRKTRIKRLRLWTTSLQYTTWKQDGGGKRVIRCAATGGTGKTPPGTE